MTSDAKWGVGVVIGVLIFITLLMVIIPPYKVWMQAKRGEADLREAEYNRQVIVEQARAELAGAELLRQAEVERARGAAEAMEIIKKELTSEYLTYRAILSQAEMAKAPNHTTVYIPAGELGVPLIRSVER